MRKLLAGALLMLCAGWPAHAAVVMKEVTYKDGATPLKGWLAYDDAKQGKEPGVLVVHEWWGITKHVKDYARELAGLGYTVLAVDMFGNGRTASEPKGAEKLATEVLGAPATMKARFDAARSFLTSQPMVDAKRVGAIGFCFGGRVVLDMARMGSDLAGVASFHGDLSTEKPAKPGAVKSKVLVLNGAADPFVPRESVGAFKKEMDAAKVTYRFVDYPGALHAFTNPEATEKGKKFNLPLAYNAEADRQAKAEMTKFFAEVLGSR